MGEPGLMSRILAPKFGAFLTFAALRDASATAPGQPTIRELLDLYRFRSINPATRVYGVIGWPVAHSRSPHVHNAGFEAVGHDAVYLPLPVPPEWEHFKATLAALLDHKPVDFRGASITLPHKEHLVRFAREDTTRSWSIDPLVERCGAANTLTVNDDGSCRIANTDAQAAVAVVRAALPQRADLHGLRVAIIGAGGVARAVAAGLMDVGATVIIYNRTSDRAQRLIDDLTASDSTHPSPIRGKVVAGPWDKLCSACCEVFVNCTSLGMAGGPDPAASPLDPAALDHASSGTLIFDTVYNPPETPLILGARAAGLRTATGVSMFVEQAALQFERWTAAPAPRALFHKIVLESLPPSTL
jgi:3-dehydroquinate dehydratase/shikimate dehydrogenase